MISKVSTITVMFACLLALTSCATTPTPSPTPAPAPPSESIEWIDKVVRAWVVAHPHNWNADAKDDGLRVWVELQDVNEDEVRYKNINVPVEIRIYSTESKTYPLKSARVIYPGNVGAISSQETSFIPLAPVTKASSSQCVNKP